VRFDAAAFLRRLAGPGLAVPGDDVEALVALWPTSPDRLGTALVSAGVDIDEDQAVEVYLLLDELVIEHRARNIDAGEPWFARTVDALMDIGATDAGLLVDEDLLGCLPLLPLARDMARREVSGRLKVELVPAERMGPADGWYTRGSRAGVILLEEALLAEPDRLARVWAHELAHGLDPDLTTVTPAGREAFAEAMAPLLVEHEPATVAEAGFLVARCLEETRPRRRSVPAGRSLVDLLEWALAEAGAWTAGPTLIAAHLGHASGVNGKPAGKSVPASGPEGGSGSSEAHLRRSAAAEGSGTTASEPSAR
jgi:hypothetical protein